MNRTDIPQPNIIFLRVAYFVCGCLLYLLFGLRIHRDRAMLKRLSMQPRPLIFVFNHTSHMDVPLVAMGIGLRMMRRITMPGKKELFEDPKTRWIMKLAGVVPLKRDTSDTAAARMLLRALQAGRYVLMSPEGTRSFDDNVQPFKVGFIKLAQRANALIVPVGINGAARALPRGAAYPKLHKITVHIGDPIDPVRLLVSNPDPEAADQVAELIRQRIISLKDVTRAPESG